LCTGALSLIKTLFSPGYGFINGMTSFSSTVR
jgi:hypothetical protein